MTASTLGRPTFAADAEVWQRHSKDDAKQGFDR
jgi:hypothetical protein